MRRPLASLIAVLSLLVGLLALLPAAAANADTAPTLDSTGDAVVNAASPTSVITGTLLRMDSNPANERQIFMRFTVPVMPAGDEVTSATLRLVNNDGNTGPVTVSSSSLSWDESTVTWNTKPTVFGAWDTQTLKPGAGVSTDLDVTQAVKNWGDGDISFNLKTTGTPVLTIGARDNANAALHPQLLIQTTTPPPPIKWGSSVETRGQTKAQALAREESTMGKGAIRVYGASPSFPSTEYGSLDDRTVVYSFKGANPAQVIAGNIDTAFRAFLTDAKAYVSDPANPTAEVFWSYYHEPEDNIAAGNFTAADYRAAWGHLIAISNEAQYQHARLKSTLILMKYTVQNGSGRTFSDYYNSGVDVLGWDGYKWDTGTSVASIVDPIVAQSAAVGKPWAIAETGVSVKHTTAQRSAALHDLAAYIANHNPEYVTYFNSDPGGPSEWNWPIDDEPTMADAWISGQDGV